MFFIFRERKNKMRDIKKEEKGSKQRRRKEDERNKKI